MSPPRSQFPPQLLLLLPLPTVLLLLAAATDHFILATAAEQQQQPIIVLPGCPDMCGNIGIPFPFGMGSGCFRKGFEVSCNSTFDPPRAFLASSTGTYQDKGEGHFSGGQVPSELNKTASSPVELIDISIDKNEARAYGAVSSYCSTSATDQVMKLQLTTTVGASSLSAKRNVLVGVGMRAEPRLVNAMLVGSKMYWSSCTSDLEHVLQQPQNGSCSGLGCCQAHLPELASPLTEFAVSFPIENNNPANWTTMPCSYGMVVESSWYNFSTPDLYGDKFLSDKFPRGVPMVLDFAIRNSSCKQAIAAPAYACISSNSLCADADTSNGYVCKCVEGYSGNPYLPNGCEDIDECQEPHLYPCYGVCRNKLGGYDCSCGAGKEGDAFRDKCTPVFSKTAKALAGAIGGILFVAALTFFSILGKEKRKTREYYKNHVLPTLEKANIIKLFKKEELMPILSNGNLIGKGSFGEVYKGAIGDKQVAIKKPINGNNLENEQFINEYIIQSQVIHKNIVRLMGCCLGVDSRLLVYEFISNGSLDDILHSNKNVALDLDTRLSIATQSADGLAYMHSKTNIKILHGDVKPANILLDHNFVPKISDFGISRLIARDKQHTDSVIGDLTYMDPVYQETGLLTEKSDVYSFGVVILELISRKKATYSDNNSLIVNFLEAHKKEKKATEYFDKEIAVTRDLELLDSLAEMAVECLIRDVDQRPTMTEVAERLVNLSRSRVMHAVCE